MASLYSLGCLPKDSYTIAVQIPGRRPDEMRSFGFKIRKVSNVNLAVLKDFVDGKLSYTPYDVITALEVIMRHPMTTNNIVVGRSIYEGSGAGAIPISGAIDVWKGFFMSLRPAFGRLLLNVDTSATAFIAGGDVIPILRDFLGLGPNDPFQMEGRARYAVEAFLRSARVEATHRGESKRKYKVLGLSPQSAQDLVFEREDGSKQSVADYFREKYGVTLRAPQLPCVQVGSPQRAIFLPMECLRIPPGQRYNRKLDPMQTSDMIKIANRKPSERMAGCRAGYRMIEAQAAFLERFQIGVSGDLLQVNGRVLQPPTILYGKDSRDPQIVPSQGSWNLRDKRVEIGATVASWAVLLFGKANIQEVKAFVTELCVTCTDTGVPFQATQPPVLQADRDVAASVQNAYRKAAEASGRAPQFVLCILPTDDAQLYGEIKRCTDTLVGLPSQCMLMKHIRRPSKQYCANLALKINVKLGGVNSSLGRQLAFITERPTIVLGADVSHPGIGEGDKPSIAAVVASMDIKMSRYAANVRVQPSRKEIIEELGAMAKEHLLAFRDACKVLPHRILFYRDGVSEGQFAQVLQFELAALKAACREIDPAYGPTITFILVQKRHHTRLFVANAQDADRSGNIPAGTVVDTAICHPSQFDFFLCSHGGLQGTSRPTHYHVVYDDHHFKADELQLLSYQLCYTFARCTRSVSVVPPAYYAHLVAFRARFHFGPGEKGGAAAFHQVKSQLASRMYFI
jgi:eukaryotic translation initiation factor 2C